MFKPPIGWPPAKLGSRKKLQPVDEPSAVLIPPAARVTFLSAPPKPPGFTVNSLSLDPRTFHPSAQVSGGKGDYEKLMRALRSDLERCGLAFTRQGILTLLAVLRKHTSRVPHTFPGEADEPYHTRRDVSLYDHLKVSCAIAACLNAEEGGVGCFDEATLDAIAAEDSEVAKLPVAYLLRGEISGIQDFIYRITQADSETGGTARRLRGRSLYVSLIVDVIADWLIRKLKLPTANILFCGGGRFDLLLPVSRFHRGQAREAEADLNRWLLENFYGELSIQMVSDVPIRAEDFKDFSNVYQAADERVREMKHRRFDSLIERERFFLGWTDEAEQSREIEVKPIYQVCRLCRVTPLSEEKDACSECEQQREIGRRLPRLNEGFLVFTYGAGEIKGQREKSFSFGEPFNLVVDLTDREQAREMMRKSPRREMTFFKLNDIANFVLHEAGSNTGFDFKFLANIAPVARKAIPSNRSDQNALKEGDVFDFTHIANELNVGAKLLGVLKMDVDHLGAIFGQGLTPNTLPRVSALSQSLDLFFSGWINDICKRVSQKWLEENPAYRELTDNLFYIVYSGGDDLIIIGPWERTLMLAHEIRKEFDKYCGGNPNVTLSGGALLVKPHFPIHRFAKLVEHQIKLSKEIDWKSPVLQRFQKDRFTAFNQTVTWAEREGVEGFEELMEFACWLAKQVESGKIPKSLLYLLLRLYDSHVKEDNSWRKAVWIPKFAYAVARRVSDEKAASKLFEDAQRMISTIRIPISYVSLRTRKE